MQKTIDAIKAIINLTDEMLKVSDYALKTLLQAFDAHDQIKSRRGYGLPTVFFFFLIVTFSVTALSFTVALASWGIRTVPFAHFVDLWNGIAISWTACRFSALGVKQRW